MVLSTSWIEKSLSYSDTNLGFHLSEENETITNCSLFCWQVHAYDKVIFSPGELLPHVGVAMTNKVFMKTP